MAREPNKRDGKQMNIQLNRWESTFIWNLLNESLMDIEKDSNQWETQNNIVAIMNKIDPEYEEDE